MTTRRLGHPVPILNGYIDDAFAIPVMANLVLCFQRVAIIKSDYYILSAGKVAFIVLYVTLAFEILFPMLSKTYTRDWIDALLYVVGGFFFYYAMNKPLSKYKV
jgi:hypothetical protein